MPVHSYKVQGKDGIVKDRNFNILNFKLDECPVSLITKTTSNPRKPDYITGPRAAELVRLWFKARRAKTTLSKLLGSNAAWVEDVETILSDTHAAVEIERRKAIDRRIS